MPDAIAVQLRRGTKLENDNFTGLQGEFTAVIESGYSTCRIHDGLKMGGYEFALANMANVNFSDVGIAAKDLSNVTDEDKTNANLLFRDLSNINADSEQKTAAGLADIQLSNISDVDWNSLTRNNIAKNDLTNVDDYSRDMNIYDPDGKTDEQGNPIIVQHGLAFKDLSNVNLTEAGVLYRDFTNFDMQNGGPVLNNILMELDGGFLKTDMRNLEDLSLVQNSGRNKIPNNQGLVNPRGALNYVSTTISNPQRGVPIVPGSETFSYWYMLDGSDAQKAATTITNWNMPKGTVALSGGIYIRCPDLIPLLDGKQWYLSLENLKYIENEDEKPYEQSTNGLQFSLAFVDGAGKITTQFTPWTKLVAPQEDSVLQNWSLVWDFGSDGESDEASPLSNTLKDWLENIVNASLVEIEESEQPIYNPYADCYLCIRTDGITEDDFKQYSFQGIQLESDRQTLVESLPTFTQTPETNLMCGTF